MVGKGENAGYQHFFFFPQFFIHSKTKIIILAIFNLSSAITFNLDQSRILSFGKELTESVILGVNGSIPSLAHIVTSIDDGHCWPLFLTAHVQAELCEDFFPDSFNPFLIHHVESIPNSKKLQPTTKMWLIKDF